VQSRCGVTRARSGECGRSTLGRLSEVEPPEVRDTFELLFSPNGEGEAASGDQVLDGLRDDDLARTGDAEEAGSDSDRQAAGLPVDDLALTDVHPGARLETEAGDTLGDLMGAVDGARRSREAGEEAVAGRVVLGAAPVGERIPHQRVMCEQELLPAAVSELRLPSRRVDEVREEH
jgi:hypothetical protein